MDNSKFKMLQGSRFFYIKGNMKVSGQDCTSSQMGQIAYLLMLMDSPVFRPSRYSNPAYKN